MLKKILLLAALVLGLSSAIGVASACGPLPGPCFPCDGGGPNR